MSAKAAKKKTMPTAEIGYALEGYDHGGRFWQAAEETPELVWPLCSRVYRRMSRQDAQIASVMRAVVLPIRRTTWQFDSNGARPEVVAHLAGDFGLPVAGAPPVHARRRGRFQWSRHLVDALLCLRYGHSYFEQAWSVDDESLYHLHKLAPRPAETLSDIEVAPDGGLVSIEQYGWGYEQGERRIPVARLLAYIHEQEGGDWTGTSLLRPAYKHWLIKDRLIRVQAQTIERNGMGVPIYEGGPNDDQVQLDAGKKIAQSYKAGSASGAATPYQAKLRLAGVEGNLSDAMPAIEYHDAQIGRSVLAHFLNLGQQTGSWALGTTFFDFFTLSLQTTAELIRDTIQTHVIDEIVEANWGAAEASPRLVFDEIGSRKDATAAALEILVRAGIITPDEAIEQAARQDYGLPIKQAADPEAVDDPAAAAPAPAPAPAARRRVTARIEPNGAMTLW